MVDVDLSLIRELVHKGYHVTGVFHAPHDSDTRPKLSVTAHGSSFVVKYSSVSHHTIGAEVKYAEKLAGIPGIVPIIDHGSVSHNGTFVQYNVKPLLPGPRLADVALTRELGDMVLETQQQMHDRNVLLERETRRDDFVLDEHGRPILVDMEYLREFDEPTSFTLVRVGDKTYTSPNIPLSQRIQQWLGKQDDKVHLLSELRHGQNGSIFRGQLLQEQAKYTAVKHAPAIGVGTVVAGAAAYLFLEPFLRW